MAKKLAGHGADTATWVTNVGNEDGQVLMSVVTAAEGAGLDKMIRGVITRYETAGVAPPDILYVDRGCCGDSQVIKLFSCWPNLRVRLDIWHFMRRFAAGCTTEAHQMYGIFMSRLSGCIFEWSKDDVAQLREATRLEMEQQHVPNPTSDDALRQLSRRSLALHCRRRTRGTEETFNNIDALIRGFSGDEGKDTLGVPLFDEEKMANIWESQKCHVSCIQDPAGYPLYSETGSVKKGDKLLPTYRCARGSTSLESFHLHLARFVPGRISSVCLGIVFTSVINTICPLCRF